MPPVNPSHRRQPAPHRARDPAGRGGCGWWGGHSCAASSYAVEHIRRGGVYFEPVTGLIAVLMFNSRCASRRSPGSRSGAGHSAALFHQFARSPVGSAGARHLDPVLDVRLRRTGPGRRGAVALTVGRHRPDGAARRCGRHRDRVGVGILEHRRHRGGTLVLVVRYRVRHRIAVELRPPAEYLNVISNILAKPWFGYGLGYSFVNRELIFFKLVKQRSRTTTTCSCVSQDSSGWRYGSG